MVRITADLILRSSQYFNVVRERELDLRGNKIAAVENLGATEDQYDCIDLSDNEIVKLEGFPYLQRLTTLLVSNNRIIRLHPNLGVNLPKLQLLVLSNNRLLNLSDLEPLSSLVNLQMLSLLDNVVTKKPNYRLFLVQRLPKLRLLDFQKVKQKEKLEAKKVGPIVPVAAKVAPAPKVPTKAETEGASRTQQAPDEVMVDAAATPAPNPEELVVPVNRDL